LLLLKEYDLTGNMGEYEESRLRIISEGACPGLIKFLKEDHRENSLEEELGCLNAIHKLSQHQKNHMRMVGLFALLLSNPLL